MMRSRIWLLTLAGFMLLSQMVTAQFFSPHSSFSFLVGEESTLILSGSSHIAGEVDALPFSTSSLPFDSSYFAYVEILYPDLADMVENLLSSGELRVYPLFAERATVDDVSTVYLVNVNTKQVVNFHNVEILLLDSSVALAGANMTLQFNNYLDYALYATVNGESFSQNTTSFIAQLMDDDMIILFGNTTYYLLASTSVMSGSGGEGGAIILKDHSNNTLWSGSDSEWIAIMESDNLLANIHTPLLILPLESGITITLEESDDMPDITYLAERASDTLPEGYGIPQMEGLSGIISAISPVINGACIVVGNNTISINGELYNIVNVGAIRFSSCNYRTLQGDNEVVSSIDGDGKLIFLGNQIYNSVPVYDVNGVPVPLHPIFVWILGVGIYLLFNFALKKRGGTEQTGRWLGRFPIKISDRNRKIIKWFSLGIHIVLIILIFVLFDSAFREVVGVSALSLSSDSNLLVLGAILSLEILCMSIAYVAFAIPTKIAFYGLLEFIGIGKEGRGIGKGAGLIVMLFAGISYVPYVLGLIVMAVREMIPNLVGFIG